MFCWRMVRANLVEALAEIDDLCQRLRYLEMGTLPEGAYGRWCEKCWKGTTEGSLFISMEHAYHHLCFAWNCRAFLEKRVIACSQADYEAWEKLPRRGTRAGGASPTLSPSRRERPSRACSSPGPSRGSGDSGDCQQFQFSIGRPAMREKWLVLFVTRTQPSDIAFAAISASITPIARPDWSSVARIVAAREAACSLNSTTGTNSTRTSMMDSSRFELRIRAP